VDLKEILVLLEIQELVDLKVIQVLKVIQALLEIQEQVDLRVIPE